VEDDGGEEEQRQGEQPHPPQARAALGVGR
jgi:hypothetical protein